MADQKISELTAKTTVHDDDLFPLVDTEVTPDETKKITGANMKSQMVAGHKDLTTGVHGVSSNYIAQAPASGHLVRSFTKGWTSGKLLKGAGADADPTEIDKSTFEWAGSDELALFPQILLHRPVFLHFESLDNYNRYRSGTGGYADSKLFSLALQTGAQANSYARISHNQSMAILMSSGQIIVFDIQIAAYSAQTIYLWLGDNENPSVTDDHMGFKMINNTLYATNADGTTEKATSFRTASSAFSTRLMVWHQGTSIKYYESHEGGAWTLVATHTDNLPNSGYERLVMHIANTEAVEKALVVFSVLAGRL